MPQPDGLDERDVAAVTSLDEYRARKADECNVVQLHIPEAGAVHVCSLCTWTAAGPAHLIEHYDRVHGIS